MGNVMLVVGRCGLATCLFDDVTKAARLACVGQVRQANFDNIRPIVFKRQI